MQHRLGSWNRCLMLATMNLKCKYFKLVMPLALFISFVLLIICFFVGAVNDGHRWIPIPVIGMQLAYCVTGAMLTETIFSWPGMGMLIVKAVTNRDYAMIQGTVVIVAIVFIVVNLLVDLAYMLVNPKVSYEGGQKS